MTSTHVPPRATLYGLPEVRFGFLRDVATKVFYFSLVTIVFVFVSTLLTGVYR